LGIMRCIIFLGHGNNIIICMNKEDYYLTNDESYSLYKMLYDIIQILEKNGVEYWVCGGTFLGAIRSKGIIRWDDDLDIEIPEVYRGKMEEIFDKSDRYGMKRSNLWYKIYYKGGENIDGKDYSYPFLDVFFMEKMSGGWRLSFPEARRLWKTEYFLDGELYPLREYKFGAYKVKGPNRYEGYFRRVYGDDWNKKAVISYNHKRESRVERIEWEMEGRDYEAAFPYYYPSSDGNDNKKWWVY